MKTVKIGDRFKFGHWVWAVDYVNNAIFTAKIEDGKSDGAMLTWQLRQADALDWIKEPATISKEARDEIVEWARGKMMALGGHGELKDYLDSMVRDGE